MSRPVLFGIAGALRAGSTNRKLIREAARLFGPAEFREANLRLPLYDGDMEDAEGIPAPVAKLAAGVAASDAIVISTPEYNSMLSGVLKNALDWVSRTEGRPFEGKPVAIISAAAGRAGGARSQFSLRLALTGFRPRILTGPEVMIANSRKAFDENGHLTDERSISKLKSLMEALRVEVERLAEPV
ncbi:NAD(P)H-dependent FMN reductase [Defluviimonas aquaemixtae]|uniref:NAD(P)H-dependent FMN reductase n=1 Tax=Albidovulum aquaemixtae TaxID=1542388 RepID=A0A2R8BLS6_9RHOB|nr:NAD(P)H-dependent oxidoreductase [Defluviimonas aquaemixtae]SPH24335.1 NAD(P)H-dependent FMN reductase [Defluviimonas aquaemixtae]